MRGLILDLRFDPGGLLSSAVEVSNIFISKGRIVSVQGRNTPERIWDAVKGESFEDFPMVVLVNHYSATPAKSWRHVCKTTSGGRGWRSHMGKRKRAKCGGVGIGQKCAQTHDLELHAAEWSQNSSLSRGQRNGRMGREARKSLEVKLSRPRWRRCLTTAGSETLWKASITTRNSKRGARTGNRERTIEGWRCEGGRLAIGQTENRGKQWKKSTGEEFNDCKCASAEVLRSPIAQGDRISNYRAGPRTVTLTP